MGFKQTSFAAVLTVVSLSTFIGCGRSSHLERVIVEGAVTFNGQPVENGEIRFHPVAGTRGPVSGAPIVQGVYRAVARGGVPVGQQLVRIEAYDVSRNQGGIDVIAGARSGSRVNYVPSKYNRESELVVIVSGDKSTMTQDFALEN